MCVDISPQPFKPEDALCNKNKKEIPDLFLSQSCTANLIKKNICFSKRVLSVRIKTGNFSLLHFLTPNLLFIPSASSETLQLATRINSVLTDNYRNGEQTFTAEDPPFSPK